MPAMSEDYEASAGNRGHVRDVVGRGPRVGLSGLPAAGFGADSCSPTPIIYFEICYDEFRKNFLDKVHAVPVVTTEDLNEPFATAVTAHRAWSLGEAVDDVLAERAVRVAPAHESGASLMGDAASLGFTITASPSTVPADECSSKAVMVEVRGWTLNPDLDRYLREHSKPSGRTGAM